MRKILILSCLTGLSLSNIAFADMSIPFGWYLEPNIGYTKVVETSYNGSTSNSGLSGSINAGYKFMPYFATELGYTRYASTTVKYNDTTAANDRHYAIDLALKGIFPLNTSGFEAFGKIGIMRMNSNIGVQDQAAASAVGIDGGGSNSSTGLYLGAGAQYYYMPELAVVVQWARSKGSSQTGTLDLYSIGISYLFGQ